MTKPTPAAQAQSPRKARTPRPNSDFPIVSDDTSKDTAEAALMFRAPAFYINTTNVMQGPEVVRIAFGESAKGVPTVYGASVAMSFGSARGLARSILEMIGDEDADE